jgi:signal transduction histidine kinase
MVRGPDDWARRRDWRSGPWRGHAPPVRLALLVAVAQVVGTSFARHGQLAARPLAPWGYLLLIAGPVALLFRRRYRVAAVAVTIGATVTYVLLGYPYGPVFVAPVVAVIGAVRAGRRVPVWVLTGVGYLLLVGLGRLPGVDLRYLRFGEAVGVLLAIGIVLLLGEAARVQARYLAELARTRDEQARTRAEQQRRQASEERLRIARELHDVLGHHLSLISVQAGVGLHLMDEHPEQARTALIAIKQASAEALREVRSVLGVLRAEDEQAPRAPAPSLTNLAALAENAGARTVIEGKPRELPAELDRAAYRIAQEALTNVRRHAGPAARATVTIGYAVDGLTVRVADDGRGSPSGPAIAAGSPSGPALSAGGAGRPGTATAGNGIAGMRARAAALGGTLTAGPGPAGGFQVEARLPFGGAS